MTARAALCKHLLAGEVLNVKKRVMRPHIGGLSRTREYRAWQGMLDRCYDKSYELYHRYGGRGITVCDRWKNNLQNFVEDMGLCPPEFNSIDRFPDNNGNYEPGNCRWANAEQQSNNRSTNLVYEIDGKTQTLKQWCTELGIKYSTVWSRIKKGKMDFMTALTMPIVNDGKFNNGHTSFTARQVINVETNEKYQSAQDAAKALKIPYTTLISQLNGIYTNKTKLSFL